VRVVLQRRHGDTVPLEITSEEARVEPSPTEVVVTVPPGPDHRAVKLFTTRADGQTLTDFVGGTSTYDCSP
jgi:hypothetical protein